MAHRSELPLEKDFQRAVLNRLRSIPGSWWVKIRDQTTIGLPDIIGCVAGVFIAIELKTKSKVTAIQAYTLKRIDASGGITYVMTPDNAKEIYAYLDKVALLKKP